MIKEKLKLFLPDILLDMYRDFKNRIIVEKSKKYHRNAFGEKKNSGDIKVVFIVYQPKEWNSLKTVYEAAVAHPDVRPYVIVISEATTTCDDRQYSALDYFKNECLDVIDCTNGNRLVDLKEIEPDFVFRQTPYDSVYPKEYSWRELSKVSKTCYIPYGYNFSPSKHLKIEYGIDTLANLFAVFSDSITNAEYCRKQANRLCLDLHVFYLGYPRFDLLKRNIINSNNIHVFTWIPRWSVDAVNNDATSFFKYNENLIKYFQSHRDLQLIIRPHPLMFDNFVKLGIMTSDEVEKYKDDIDKENNIFLDNNIDYLDTFAETDVLIADMSSINYEFYLLGKPMIYCGNPLEYNVESKKMMECSYIVSDWKELENSIENLCDGIDPTFVERERDINKIFSNIPTNIGKKIINECVRIMRQ